VAPDARHTGNRHELLARAARRMLEREVEGLAIEQLPLAGHADDPRLARAEQTMGHPVQEQAAARCELKSGPQSPQALLELEESLERLRSQRMALPVHKLTQPDDAEARLGKLTSERDHLLKTLRALPEPEPRRFLGNRRDPGKSERTRLVAAVGAHDDELERAGAHRARLERELGDPEQLRSERAGLDRAIDQITDQSTELRQRLAERELEGPNRHDPIPRARGEEPERSATYDLDLGL
jgi:hypothetical protein